MGVRVLAAPGDEPRGNVTLALRTFMGIPVRGGCFTANGIDEKLISSFERAETEQPAFIILFDGGVEAR